MMSSNPKQYLVVLSRTSELGRVYAAGNHDYMTTADNPCLLCTELEHVDTLWTRVVRPLRPAPRKQVLQIRANDIVVIHELGEKEAIPIGYVPVGQTNRVSEAVR
jgi:hypothetical protein